MPTKFQNTTAHRLFTAFVVGFVTFLGLASMALITLRQHQLPTSVAPPPTPTMAPAPHPTDPFRGWQTIINPELGVQLRVPPELTIDNQTEAPSIILSSSPDFDPAANLIITIEPYDTADFSPATDVQTITTVTQAFDTQALYNNFFLRTLEVNWLGDPPWSYYQFGLPEFPSREDTSLAITIRISRIDDLPPQEGGTSGQIHQQANNILTSLIPLPPTPTSP